MNREPSTDILKSKLFDYSVAAARGAANIVPIVGPIIAEIIAVRIPSQRVDRIAKFAEELERRLSNLENGWSETQLENEEVIDLIEEGLRQATHSLSDERREYIALLIVNGLSSDQMTYTESRHLLRLLDEINDIEIIWLRFYHLAETSGGQDFRNTHEEILTHIMATVGSTQDIVDKETLQKSYSEHLAQLGLLERRYRTDLQTKMPAFDSWTGAMEVSSYETNGLGRMLLKEIGLGEKEEAQ